MSVSHTLAATEQQSPALPSIQSVERLKLVLGSAGEHLGDMVWWTLVDASVGRSTLEYLWAQSHLPSSLLPEPPTAEKALRLAVKTAQVGQAEHLVRPAKDAQDELVYAVVREEKPGDGTLSYSQEARVALNRVANSLTTDAPTHPLVQAVEESFQAHLSMHTADDIRRTLVKALQSFAAVTLRDSGGVYWVPRPSAAELRRLKVVVEQLGTSRFDVVPVHYTAEGSKALGEVARGSLEAELATLNDELQDFVTAPPDRPSTLERRLKAFEELRTRAQLYRDILRVQVEDLEGRLDGMAEQVQQLLTAGGEA